MQSFYLNQTKPTLCSPKQTFCAYEHMTSVPTEVIEKTVLQTKGLSCSYITWRKWHVFSRPSEKPELTSSDQRWGCSPWLCASLRRLSSVQFSCSVMSDSLRPHELQHARPPCPSPTLGVHPNSCPSSQWCHPSIHLILCRLLLLLPPIPPSIRVFSNESTLRMRWPKYWSFSFSISPSKEHPGLISFRMDWLDLLGVQGTLKSLLQHHSSEASILQCSAFLTIQLTSIHDHWKNHSLN